MEDRHVGRRQHSSIFGKARSAKDNVVALPLTRFAARVHERNMILVNARSLAIRISTIVIRVQNLNHVPSLKKNSAVAAILSFAFDLHRTAPLDVKLAIPEGAFRPEVAGRFND